jgi:hypothetical protein
MRPELVLLAALIKVSPVLTAPCTALTTLLLSATVTPLWRASNWVSCLMLALIIAFYHFPAITRSSVGYCLFELALEEPELDVWMER